MADRTFEFKITVDRTDEVMAELDKAIDRALEAAGSQAESYAKLELERSPRRVDTGLLRNSITHAMGGEAPPIKTYHGDNPSRYSKVEAIPIGYYNGTAPQDTGDERTCYVGTNVEYAVYVHEGAHLPNGGYMAPNHFIRNALENNEKTLRNIIDHHLRGGA